MHASILLGNLKSARIKGILQTSPSGRIVHRGSMSLVWLHEKLGFPGDPFSWSREAPGAAQSAMIMLSSINIMWWRYIYIYMQHKWIRIVVMYIIKILKIKLQIAYFYVLLTF